MLRKFAENQKIKLITYNNLQKISSQCRCRLTISLGCMVDRFSRLPGLSFLRFEFFTTCHFLEVWKQYSIVSIINFEFSLNNINNQENRPCRICFQISIYVLRCLKFIFSRPLGIFKKTITET